MPDYQKALDRLYNTSYDNTMSRKEARDLLQELIDLTFRGSLKDWGEEDD